MIHKVTQVPDETKADEVQTLYLELLRSFHEDDDQEAAEQIASRLGGLLDQTPEIAESIRGEEIRSLIAEVRGDYPEAIRRRECEIRKIFQLHSITKDTPGWEYAFRQYDYSDISDRYDLLATLFAEAGELDSAVNILRESEAFCRAHGIPFDGADLLEEYEQERMSEK